MSKIKNNDHENVCALCEHATPLKGLEGMVCAFKGVVSEDNSCRRFSYDILKREPLPIHGGKLPD